MRLRMVYVVGGVPRANAAVVLAEGHIQDPVVGVFAPRGYPPVPEHGLQLEPGLGGQAGHEDADVGRDPVADAEFALDPDQTGQVAPFVVGIAGHPAAADRDAPVVLADRVRVVVGIAGEVSGPFQGEGVLQARMKALVVVPDAQHVVGPLLPDRACDGLLATHGVQGHDATLQAQHAQQLRDGRACVGLVVHRRLNQDQAVGLEPGTDPNAEAPAPDPGRGNRARSGRRRARLGR